MVIGCKVCLLKPGKGGCRFGGQLARGADLHLLCFKPRFCVMSRHSALNIGLGTVLTLKLWFQWYGAPLGHDGRGVVRMRLPQNRG